MPLSIEFKELVQRNVQRDPAFARALLSEAIQSFIEGDVETGKLMLRDYVNATIGFSELADATGHPDKSLMRMLSAAGNPQARSLFRIIEVLQERTGLKIEVRAR